MISGRVIREVLQGDAARVKAPRSLWEKIKARLGDRARDKGPISGLVPPGDPKGGGLIPLQRHRTR